MTASPRCWRCRWGLLVANRAEATDICQADCVGAFPEGTITFVFTDIERSTETVTEVGDERFAELLDLHHRILRNAFDAAAASRSGPMGTPCSSRSARQQRRGRRRSRPGGARGLRLAPRSPLRVRIGMHSGEAVIRNGNYVGLEVHRAERVCDAGHGGQVLLSRRPPTSARPGRAGRPGSSPAEGHLRAEQLFQLGSDQFPAVRSPASPRSSLPRERSRSSGGSGRSPMS